MRKSRSNLELERLTYFDCKDYLGLADYCSKRYNNETEVMDCTDTFYKGMIEIKEDNGEKLS